MAEQLNDREGSGLADKLMQYLPARFRPGTAVVPVVRLSGVIGALFAAIRFTSPQEQQTESLPQ